MSQEVPITDLERLAELVSAFAGGSGQIRSYTVSHRRLVISLETGILEERRFLLMTRCRSLELPTDWELVSPSVAGKQQEEVRFTDDGCQVVCMDISLWKSDPTWERASGSA